MKNTKENDSEKFALIERWQQSKQSISEFCKSEKIANHSFYYWHQKYKRQNNKPAEFIKIAASVIPQTQPSYCTLHFTNGTRIVFNEEPTVGFIKKLI